MIEQIAVTLYSDRSTRIAFAPDNDSAEAYTREYPPLRAEFFRDSLWRTDERFMEPSEFDAIFGPRRH